MALHFESSSPQILNNSLKKAIFALKKEPTVEDGFEFLTTVFATKPNHS
jgi:hypothetical protein